MGLNKKDGIDKRKIAGKFQNTLRLNNTFLNNTRVKEETSIKKLKSF